MKNFTEHKTLSVTKMLRIFFLLLLVGVSVTTYSQTDLIIARKNNLSVADIDTLTGIKNKTLRCEYDTLYIINRYGVTAFQKAINDLQRVKNLAVSLDSLTLNISSMQTDVNRMYYNMNDVTGFIKKFNAETDNNLRQLALDNKNLNDNLLITNEQLMQVKAKLKAQQLKNFGKNLLWGAGGFTVGGLLVGLLLVK